MENTALAALQRSLSENREAKRKIQLRLAEMEAESAVLRSQVASLDALIEQTELALLKLLFPSENKLERPAPPATNYPPYRHLSPSALHSPETGVEAEIDAEVAKIRQNEKSSIIRFNDFRIPQAATIVLREADGPLHVSEIYRRMADGGFEFRGQHQLITLAVSLSRSKRFRKVAPGTFELNPADEAGQVA